MSARQVVLGVVLGAVALAALAAGLVLFLFRPLKAEPVALDALKGLRTRGPGWSPWPTPPSSPPS